MPIYTAHLYLKSERQVFGALPPEYYQRPVAAPAELCELPFRQVPMLSSPSGVGVWSKGGRLVVAGQRRRKNTTGAFCTAQENGSIEDC